MNVKLVRPKESLSHGGKYLILSYPNWMQFLIFFNIILSLFLKVLDIVLWSSRHMLKLMVLSPNTAKNLFLGYQIHSAWIGLTIEVTVNRIIFSFLNSFMSFIKLPECLQDQHSSLVDILPKWVCIIQVWQCMVADIKLIAMEQLEQMGNNTININSQLC